LERKQQIQKFKWFLKLKTGMNFVSHRIFRALFFDIDGILHQELVLTEKLGIKVSSQMFSAIYRKVCVENA
jgi:hypothetical protein